MSLIHLDSRHPIVPHRSLALSEAQAEVQIQRGLFTTERGVRLAIPVDRIKQPEVFLNRDLWRQDREGRVYRPGARFSAPGTQWQGKLLGFLRDHVNENIPAYYYRAVLGHDAHLSIQGNLFARHWHAGWANPFNPDKVEMALDPKFQTFFDTHFRGPHDCRLGSLCPSNKESAASALTRMQSQAGFTEDLGWISGAKVTTAFRDEIVDELFSTTGTEFADFDYHEVGTSTTAESNAHTALQATTSIARATGTPTDGGSTYASVATITADTTESWEEHGIFNNTTSVAMMDRNLTGGQSVNSSDQVEYTYTLTVNAEA